MSTSWGGARTPANPAVVSGPGAMSARTDGGVMNPNSPSYGEGAALESLKQTAPMAGSTGAPAGPQGGGMPIDMSRIVGLGAPSQDQRPVTSGAAAGAGPGPELLGLPMDPVSERRADVQSLSPAMINALIASASAEGATPSFKRRVREIFANS